MSIKMQSTFRLKMSTRNPSHNNNIVYTTAEYRQFLLELHAQMASCVSGSDRVLSPSMYTSFIHRWLSPVIDADTGCGSGRRYFYRQARGCAIYVPDPSERRGGSLGQRLSSCHVCQHNTRTHTPSLNNVLLRNSPITID